MQWKSLLVFIAVADAALARGHGRERRHNVRRDTHLGQVAQEQLIKARDGDVAEVTNIRTVVDLDVVTVTTTTTIQPNAHPAPTSTDTTLTAKPQTTSDGKDIDATNDAANNAKNLAVSITVEQSASEQQPHQTSTISATQSSTTGSTADPSAWTSVPSNGKFSTAGFGKSTNSSGSGIEYSGNVGDPWGSNIIQVSENDASQYKYVIQFTGSNTEAWTVVFWNKIGPDGKMDGWYGHSALNFTLAAGETRYVAFAENSQGAWGAAAGDELPTDDYGGYSCTWGEFDFGDTDNSGWSGWDVSAIQAQSAGQAVQGMRICTHSDESCSYITTGAEKVVNAYTEAKKSVDGIGGTASSGAVRLKVHVDYNS